MTVAAADDDGLVVVAAAAEEWEIDCDDEAGGHSARDCCHCYGGCSCKGGLSVDGPGAGAGIKTNIK